MKKMMMSMMLLLAASLYAQETTVIAIHPQDGKNVISKNIYGQFAEHLGTCIYGGLWVGENSSIPNTNGYRNDVLNIFLRKTSRRFPSSVSTTSAYRLITWYSRTRKAISRREVLHI